MFSGIISTETSSSLQEIKRGNKRQIKKIEGFFMTYVVFVEVINIICFFLFSIFFVKNF
jgi:hypothetical protein